MDPHELVQFAALVARHAPLLIHSAEPFPEAAIERYWAASKCRQDGWGRALKQFTAEQQDMGPLPESSRHWIQPYLEEILISESISRIWAAISELADAKRGTATAGPIAQNILAGHLEARSRVLNLMVYGYGLRVEEAVALNRLRLRHERWTDILLSLVGTQAARSAWAFQPGFVHRLAETLRQRDSAFGAGVAKSLLVATITSASQHSRSPFITPHAELNRRLACSIIACFPPYVFDGTGLPISAQQLWLWQSASDTHGKVEFAQTNVVADASSVSNTPPRLGESFRRFDLR